MATPNYKEVALLTRLRIEMPQMTKKDGKATEDAESANNAHGAGVYRKDLYPKHLIDPITQVASAARAYMYSQTRPYGYSGQYLLPNRRIVGYLDQMSKFELAFKQAVTAFLNNWSNVLLEAQSRQGDLYDPTQYPDVSSLADQFIFDVPVKPFASAGDVIMDELDADVQDIVMRKLQRTEQEEVRDVVRGAFTDLREQVLRIVKQTTVAPVTNKKGEVEMKSGKIYETLTSDIKELTELLADLNFGGSPVLAELGEQIDMHLTIPAASLKGNPDVCEITNAKAKEILAQMDAFL